MSRIGAHISGFELRLLNELRASEGAAALGSLRLATGRKINDPRDNPSGFIDVTRLENELAHVQTTASNVAAAASIASQSQLAVDQIRTQLDAIRALLVEDEDQSLSAAEREANQAQIDAALGAIRTLAGTPIDGRRRLDGSTDFRTSGINRSQVRELRVLAPGVARITGLVTRPATRATLTYTGAAGQAMDAATFTLTGKRGSISINVVQNQDLTDVADTVNQNSHKTGITAAVDGDELIFTSVDYGAAARVGIVVSSGTFDVTGDQGNGVAYGTNADVTINGRHFGPAQDAVEAAVIHTAASGQIDEDIEFTITGGVGSANFSFSSGQTLANIAASVAAQAGTTGVTAEISGDGQQLTIRSIATGQSAALTLRVTLGTFDVQKVSLAEITSSTAGEFAELHHDEADGTIDGLTTIRVQGLVGSRDIAFLLPTSLDDAATQINGQTANTGVEAFVTGGGTRLEFRSVAAESSAFVDVSATLGTFDVEGGDGNGHDVGQDAVTAVRGADAAEGHPQVDGNRVSFAFAHERFELVLAAGFRGRLDTIDVHGDWAARFQLYPSGQTSTLGIAGLLPGHFIGISGSLAQLQSGGGLDGLGTNTAQAIRVADESLARLIEIEGQIDGFANSAVAASAAFLAGLEGELQDALDAVNQVDEDEENLLVARNEALAANALSSLSILQQQRARVVELLEQIAGF